MLTKIIGAGMRAGGTPPEVREAAGAAARLVEQAASLPGDEWVRVLRDGWPGGLKATKNYGWR